MDLAWLLWRAGYHGKFGLVEIVAASAIQFQLAARKSKLLKPTVVLDQNLNPLNKDDVAEGRGEISLVFPGTLNRGDGEE